MCQKATCKCAPDELKAGDKVRGRYNAGIVGEVRHRHGDKVWVEATLNGVVHNFIQPANDWVKVKPKTKVKVYLYTSSGGRVYASVYHEGRNSDEGVMGALAGSNVIDVIEKEYEV